VIPHNLRYRPTGVCPVETALPQDRPEVVVHPIYPRLVTTLDISEELYQACSEYWKPQRSVVTDYVVVEVPQGRIHTDNESSVAVISRNNRVVTNVSLTLRDGKVCDDSQNNIFSQRFFSEPHRLKGTVFTLLSGGAGVNNISHWFLDVLPRLRLLQESGLFDWVDWFLVPSTRYSYQTETLSLLGIPSERVISGEDHAHVAADRVIASTAPRGRHTLVPRWLLDYLRGAFLAQAPQEDAGPEAHAVAAEGPFLYISRRDSSIRNVLNEGELQGVLAGYGFSTIVSSGYSIVEKVRLFSKARFVMSPTGAGLISVLFCQPGTRLVEIFNEGFVIEPFYDIATKLELDYRYIICKSPSGKKARNAAQGQRDHLVVEPRQVEEVLRRAIQPPQ
jgi:capsular polysaccharide biosynthesis protein